MRRRSTPDRPSEVCCARFVAPQQLRQQVEALRSIGAATAAPRALKAKQAVELVRALGPYRWAGLYDVSATEIAVIAWDGPEGPTYPRFPVTQGLNGAAVSSGKPVIVQDVTVDPRYLTTISGPAAR